MSTSVTAETGASAPGCIRTRQDFARELTILREQAGLTVRQVASKTGAASAHSTIGDWCAGRSLPSLTSRDLFLQVVRTCGVSEAGVLEQWHQAWLRVRRAPGRPATRQEPYRGLASFQAEDAEWFFGRRALTAQLLDRLAELDRAGGGLQLVIGPSGSGKSSLLRAGLIPALKDGRLHQVASQRAILLTPGPCPVETLGEALGGLTDVPADEMASLLRANPAKGTLTNLVERRVQQDTRPVIVVDQFEEAFAPYVDPGERQLFIDALCTAAASPTAALVVLGLRADCYAEALLYPELAAVAAGQFVVGPMNEAELREAIVAPAHKSRIAIEDGLVELLLREVAPRGYGQPGAHGAGVLPLLSHALYATWEHGEGHGLTIAGYREVGGIDGAVAASADNVFNGLTPAQRDLARSLFLRLVCVATDMPDTRRRATPAELRATCGEDRVVEFEDVLDHFVAARLITADTDTVEITHEALLTAWPQLRTWLDTDRAGLVTGRQLGDAAASWQREGRDPAALYRRTRLVTANEWAARQHGDLPPLVATFLADSNAQREDEDRRTRRRVRWRYQIGAVLAALLLVAASATLYARQLQLTGSRDRIQTLSRLVADEANRLRVFDPSLSAQLAVAGYRISPTPEALSSLLNSTAVPIPTRVLTSSGQAESAAVSGDKRLLAAGTDTGRVQLWTIAAGGGVSRAVPSLTGGSQPIVSLAFSPDTRVLAGGSEDGKVYLWDLARPARPVAISTPTEPSGGILSIAVSSDGRTLAAGGANSKVYLWNISNPAHPVADAVLSGAAAEVSSVAFSPNGRVLAAGSYDTNVRLWSVANPARPSVLSILRTHSEIYSIAISHDGRQLAAGTAAEHSVYLWNISNPTRPALAGPPLQGPASWVNSVSFSPDGSTLAAGSSDTLVWLFNLRTRQVIGQLPHPVPVTAAAYSGSRSLVTVAADGVVRIWNLPSPIIVGARDSVWAVSWDASGHELGIAPGTGDNTLTVWNLTDPRHPTPQGPALVNAANASPFSGAGALTPGGRTFVAGCDDGTIQLWNISNHGHPTRIGAPFHAASATVQAVAISNNGHTAAISSNDGAVHLIDITNLRHPIRLATIPGGSSADIIYQSSLSPDGRLLAEASQDGDTYLWDIADQTRPRLLATLGGFAGAVYSAAFSHDGELLAAGSADGTIRVWNITDPHHPAGLGRPLSGPVGYVYSVAFDPTSDLLAAGSGDDTVWLWDETHPSQPVYLATLIGPTQGVLSIAFSPNGHTLAAGSQDRTVRTWNIDTESAEAQICATVGTPITKREWDQYVPGQPYDPPCP